MPGDDDDDLEYAMAFPFVTVQTQGGPHEDNAYCAGYEMGQLDKSLADVPAWVEGGTFTIQTVNIKQADIIAMNYGFVAEFETCPESEGFWTHMSVRRSEG